MAGTIFISWVPRHRRSTHLAAELGADAVFVAVGRVGNRRTAPFRHAVQAVMTCVVLARQRPRKVYVMAPPALLVAIVSLYGAVFRAAFAVDAHTSAVIALRSQRKVRVMPQLLRRARLVMVTNDDLARRVHHAGAHPVVVHNPPPAAPVGTRPTPQPAVVVPLGWSPDEPIDAIVDAARLLPDQRFVLTGRPRASMVPADVPANVTLSEHLDDADYDELLAGASVVVALTTRPHTMQQAAYEAMALARPLVLSDTEVLRGYFDDAAVYTACEPDAIAAAVSEALQRSVGLALRIGQLIPAKRAEFDEVKKAILRLMR